MSPVLFFLVAALAVLGALVVVVHKNPVYCALGLVGTLGSIAIFFVALDAEMVGVLQIIVYAGAIVVLFLFVINLLNLQVETEAMEAPALVAVATAGGIALAAVVGALVARAPLEAVTLPEGYGGTRLLAERLFTTYLLPFELTSVLLLVAIIGAVVLGKRRTAP